MVTKYVKQYVVNKLDEFTNFYKNSPAEFNKMGKDITYVKEHGYIVFESRNPKLPGFRAVKLTDERKSKLKDITLIDEADDFLKEVQKSRKNKK